MFNPVSPGAAGWYATSAAYYDWTPESLLPGYSFDGSNLTFPLSVLSPFGLTEITASALGDARQLAAALLGRIDQWVVDNAPQAITSSVYATISSATAFPKKLLTRHTFNLYSDRPEGTLSDEP